MADYYDLSAADARVKELRPILEALLADRDTVSEVQRELVRLHASNGGAASLARLEQRREQMATTLRRMEAAVRQIDAWGVTLRDIGTGSVDFPALANGRPIWLCWKLGEESVTFQHRQDEGCEMRQPLADIEHDGAATV